MTSVMDRTRLLAISTRLAAAARRCTGRAMSPVFRATAGTAGSKTVHWCQAGDRAVCVQNRQTNSAARNARQF